jgi:hypothetical protein
MGFLWGGGLLVDQRAGAESDAADEVVCASGAERGPDVPVRARAIVKVIGVMHGMT